LHDHDFAKMQQQVAIRVFFFLHTKNVHAHSACSSSVATIAVLQFCG